MFAFFEINSQFAITLTASASLCLFKQKLSCQSLFLLIVKTRNKSHISSFFYNRSPGLASPPVRNFTPTSVSMQAADMTSRHSDVTAPVVAHMQAHLPHAPARPAHQPPAVPANESHAPTSVHNSASPQEVCPCRG